MWEATNAPKTRKTLVLATNTRKNHFGVGAVEVSFVDSLSVDMTGVDVAFVEMLCGDSACADLASVGPVSPIVYRFATTSIAPAPTRTVRGINNIARSKYSMLIHMKKAKGGPKHSAPNSIRSPI